MHSTGKVIDGAGAEDVVVLTEILCTRPDQPVQRRYMDDNGEVC